MWSIKDEQTGRILHSGRNSDTKEKSLEGAWSFFKNGISEVFSQKEIDEMLENTESWLKTVGLKAFEHDEPIDERC